MIEVNISKRINEKKYIKLIDYICNISNEICFTSFHQYHLDEQTGVDILNEYKQRCKEKHHEIQKWYDAKETFLMKLLKKQKIRTEEEFLEYKEQIYLADMSLCKKMDEVIESLIKNEDQRDYQDVFKIIANDFKEIEIHLFDSTTISLMPLDLVIYRLSDTIKELLLKTKDLSTPFLINEDKSIFLINPVFCKDDEAFAVINNETSSLTIAINEKEYLEFKKLKIKHDKEIISDEK